MAAARDQGPGQACGADEESAPLVLVVDDSAVDCRLAGAILEQKYGARVAYAANGHEALDELQKQMPTLVLTDLQMPGMDGLQLVAEVRAKYPSLPVVLMTASGNEELAMCALRAGAASYVPKRVLVGELAATIDHVISAARLERRRNRVLECITRIECQFELENDPSLAQPLIMHIQEQMIRMRLCSENNKIRVGISLEEAMLNGIYHGNLELCSDLREDGSDRFQTLAAERRTLAPYRDRRLHVEVRLSAQKALFVIRDEGPGFIGALPDPTDAENLLRTNGRGLLLIRTFMDEVRHNQTGNEITMVKYADK